MPWHIFTHNFEEHVCPWTQYPTHHLMIYFLWHTLLIILSRFSVSRLIMYLLFFIFLRVFWNSSFFVVFVFVPASHSQETCNKKGEFKYGFKSLKESSNLPIRHLTVVQRPELPKLQNCRIRSLSILISFMSPQQQNRIRGTTQSRKYEIVSIKYLSFYIRHIERKYILQKSYQLTAWHKIY